MAIEFAICSRYQVRHFSVSCLCKRVRFCSCVISPIVHQVNYPSFIDYNFGKVTFIRLKMSQSKVTLKPQGWCPTLISVHFPIFIIVVTLLVYNTVKMPTCINLKFKHLWFCITLFSTPYVIF